MLVLLETTAMKIVSEHVGQNLLFAPVRESEAVTILVELRAHQEAVVSSAADTWLWTRIFQVMKS